MSNSKTTRNLSQFAEKKLVGRAHTRADRSDVSEGIPSNIQLTTTTIFGEVVPGTPADNAGSIALYGCDSNNTVQKVELDVTVISGTSYDADASTDKGGGDSPQGTGTHAYSLSLPSDYESPTDSSNNPITNHNPKKGTGVFVNDKRLYDTLGGLQIVPTNLWIDPTFVTPNPYDVKIYYQDRNGVAQGILGKTDHIDWFIDPYAGIVFLQEFDQDKIPYKVECFIYIGDMANVTGGAGALNDLSDVNITSPTNNQVLAYNSTSSKWEAQNASGGGGIERYSYTQTGSSAAADTAITISGMDFDGATPSVADTKVFLNGQLLTGGTTTQLGNDEVDYAFSSDTQIKFGFVLEVDDHVSIYYITTSFSTGKDILLHTDDAAFNNGRVITAGDGITISVATPRQLIVNNSGLLQRTKEYFTGLTHSSNEFTFSFAGSINFGTVGHSDHRIDVFVDGLLKQKDQDYSFVDDGNGGLENNKIEWIGGSTPSNSARFTIIIF